LGVCWRLTVSCFRHAFWCAAVCCAMLQCVAVCYCVLQCVRYEWVRNGGSWLFDNVLGMLFCGLQCCSVLQCVAVCCSVLQCVAVCCSIALWRSMLQCVTYEWVMPHIWLLWVVGGRQNIHETHRSTLQHTATHCSTLQHTTTYCNALQHATTRCNMLLHTHKIFWFVCWCHTPGISSQRVAVCCSVLQWIAMYCSVLQRVAACCSVLQWNIPVILVRLDALLSISSQCVVCACCSVLQCFTACCSVLQCVAACLKRVAALLDTACCIALQCIAVHCSVLQVCVCVCVCVCVSCRVFHARVSNTTHLTIS